MTIKTRTQLATILRQVAQGLLSKLDAYHMIKELHIKGV